MYRTDYEQLWIKTWSHWLIFVVKLCWFITLFILVQFYQFWYQLVALRDGFLTMLKLLKLDQYEQSYEPAKFDNQNQPNLPGLN